MNAACSGHCTSYITPPKRYNLSTALRQSWTGTLTGWVFWRWLPLVGFRPVMVLTMQAISLLYQFWIHTELVRSLGPLEMMVEYAIASSRSPRIESTLFARLADYVVLRLRASRLAT